MIDPRTALMTVPGAARLVESITAINHRAHQLASVLDRLGPALDDLSVLLEHTQRIAESAEGINRHAAGIDRHAEGINRSAELIAAHSGKIATSLPTVERLAHVLDPSREPSTGWAGSSTTCRSAAADARMTLAPCPEPGRTGRCPEGHQEAGKT